MKNLKVKLAGLLATVIAFSMVMPIQVLATGEDTQIIKQSDSSYLVYVKDQTSTFNYAISDNASATELELNYQQSVKDADNNEVAFISSTAAANADYLYISGQTDPIELDLSTAFDADKMEYVEKTTKRILTTPGTKKDVTTVDGVEVTTIVGTLEVNGVTEEYAGVFENAEYFYSMTKLPAAQYSELKELAEKIDQQYETMSMFSKIEIAQQFYNLYKELVDGTTWETVVDNVIIPEQIQEEAEEYVVFLRAVDGANEVVDVNFMTSHRENTEESIPAKYENKEVKETTKLPITYDSMILFGILAVIVIAAAVVYVRMKNVKEQGK